jgi:hypothetical protein
LATIQHPASLNPLKQFGQACAILKTTSRAQNPAWYLSALELDLQLHIRADGPSVVAFYFDRRTSKWSAGPSLTEDHLREAAKIEALSKDLIAKTRAEKATSLGVVLHIADEFATTELKPELDNPAALPDLRMAAISDPASILDDSSIPADQNTWRVIPYTAQGSEVVGTTITMARKYQAFAEGLRLAGESENLPLITHSLSAPLVAIMGVPALCTFSPSKPFAVILQYPWFTVMAFFNEHGDLRLIRTLQHRGQRRPPNFRHALSTTNASLEFVDPDLFLMPLGGEIDPNMERDLITSFPGCRIERLQPATAEGLPEWFIEPLISTSPAPEGPSPSHTFTILREDKWSLQDFLPPAKEAVEVYPSRTEMKLLRVLRLARVAVFAAVVLAMAWLAFGLIDVIRRPEWAFNPVESDTVARRLANLNAEKLKAEHWDNLLDDRSKAWTTMELVARLFPERSGYLVKNINHTVRPDSAPGQAKVGFVKEWKIVGLARDEALDPLNALNTREGISSHFAEIARITGNPSFRPDIGNRTLVTNVRIQENSTYKPTPEDLDSDEASYPFSFDLTITQRFEATDPMAVMVTKVP